MKKLIYLAALFALVACDTSGVSFEQTTSEHIAMANEACAPNEGVDHLQGYVTYDKQHKAIPSEVSITCKNGANFYRYITKPGVTATTSKDPA